MTHVALLWHMHQPYYEDLATREHILPWVRLRALKDYSGMVALLREFPGVRMTFNLVPSLLVQLEAFAADRARDRCLDLSLTPATELTTADVDFILEHFFHAQQQHMIDAYPRYGELLARRGPAPSTAADRQAVAARFAPDDLRDLQVWHKLAWVDPFYLDYLAGLPSHLSFTFAGTRLAMFPGSPCADGKGEITHYIYPQDRQQLQRLADIPADVIVLGHTHVPFVHQNGGALVINPGSCSESRDGTLMLSCAMFDPDSGLVDFRRFSLDGV